MIYEVIRELNAMFTGADDPPLETVIERDELVGSVGAELVEPLSKSFTMASISMSQHRSLAVWWSYEFTRPA